MWDTDIEIDHKFAGNSNVNQVSPGYFATLGTPIVAGRDFDERDVPGSTRVAIVTQSFVDKFLKGPPIGQHFVVPDDRGKAGLDLEIVGVVSDQKYLDIRETTPKIFFMPSSQELEPRPLRRYVLRSTEPPAAIDRGHHRDGGGLRPDGDDPLRARSIRRSPRRCSRSASWRGCRPSSEAWRSSWRSSAFTVSCPTRWRAGARRSACASRWAQAVSASSR